MPLPKTASIAARATEVYSEAWSVLLQKCWGVAPQREEEMADIFQLLPYLRQLLTCCACAGLLEDAMISLDCGHCYCSLCQFRPPLLKIQCRQCRERRGLVIETQIRLLVDCYKKMCLIIASELRDNPLVLGVREKDPVNYVDVDKEKTVNGVKEGGDVKLKSKPPISSAPFNPISEILKEVEEGTKVSRAVLVIKPPSKYVNAKMTQTPKKDPSLSSKATPTANDKLEKEAENNTPVAVVRGGEEGTKKKRGRKAKRQLSLSIPYKLGESSESSVVVQDSPKEKVGKGQGKEECSIVPASNGATHVTDFDLTQAQLALDNLRPVQLEVSVKSLDSKVIKVNSGRITIKPEKNKIGEDNLSFVTPAMLKYVRFVLDKDGNRKRVWNPLCPKVVVKRSRASIDKMLNLQTRTVGARLRSKERKKKTQTPPSDSPTGKSGKSVKKREQEETLSQREEEMEKRLEQIDREHGLQFPDLDDLDPDLELDASWLEELCEGIDEDFQMYFTQPPVPPPPPHPPMQFAPSSTPPHHPGMFGPPYSPQHHLPPHPHHHFPPHHPPPFMHPHLHPPPPPHPFMARHHHPPPLPPPTHHQPRPHLPHNRPPPIRIHRPPSPPPPPPPEYSTKFHSKQPLPIIVGKLNIGKSPSSTSSPRPLLSPGTSSKAKKRRSPGYSESGWRCRCGTNNVMFPKKVCAKGKCPCYSKGIPCKNCLCKNCHNPFNNEDDVEEEEEEEEEEGEEMEEETDLDQSEEMESEVNDVEQVM